MATPHPYPTAPSSPQASPAKPKALIVISSARTLPLAQPSGHSGISTGFFLVEMAKVLQAFGDDYDLVFATPDGRPRSWTSTGWRSASTRSLATSCSAGSLSRGPFQHRQGSQAHP